MYLIAAAEHMLELEADGMKPPTMIERVLTYLVVHGSINRLEAEKAPVFDHTITSTMSNEVKRRLGLEFTSTAEKSASYDGLGAIYHRYTLTAESTEAAMRLINEYRIKRRDKDRLWEGAA